MLVSAGQQRESALYVNLSPPSRAPPPTAPIPAFLGHHSTPSWAPWAVQQLPITSLFCIYASVNMSVLPSGFIPPSPPPHLMSTKSVFYVCISISAQ